MDSRWFKEDRALPADERHEAQEESIKALKNSTLITRRLKRILGEMLQEADKSDEDFSKPNWKSEAIANISRRKTLNDIIKLIEMK